MGEIIKRATEQMGAVDKYVYIDVSDPSAGGGGDDPEDPGFFTDM